MPTAHHHYLHGHRLEEMPWHGITRENPPVAVATHRAKRFHWPSAVPYALLVFAVVLLAASDKALLSDYTVHVVIGLLALACGKLGRMVCQHRTHQFVTTVALILIEAVVTVQVVG